MKRYIGFDELLDSLRIAHPLETRPQLLLPLLVDARGGQCRCCRLEDAAHLIERHRAFSQQQVTDKTGALQQQVWLEAADVRPVALAHLEHSELGERADRLPKRVAGQTELRCQLALLGQSVARTPGT